MALAPNHSQSGTKGGSASEVGDACFEVPRINMSPETLARSLKSKGPDSLCFPVQGTDFFFMPYWDTGEEGFTCVPVIKQ
jgi:hypothetical protein